MRQMKSERSIKRDFQYLSITTIVVSMLVLSSLWIFFDYRSFLLESERLRARHMSEYENLLKFQVETIVNNIHRKQSTTEILLKKQLKERTTEAQQVITNLFSENTNLLPQPTLEKLARDFLRNIRFNEGQSYYFAVNMNGTLEVFPPYPEEGRDLWTVNDATEKTTIEEMLRIAKSSGEGFYHYPWSKPDKPGTQYPKIAYIKYIPELDWMIGTGEYLDDFTSRIQEEVGQQVERIRFGKNNDNYVFIATWDGVGITYPAKGKNMLDTRDSTGKFIVRELIKKAKEGGGFVRYVMPPLTDSPQKAKLSYVAGIPEWQWYVGAGIYLDEIEGVIAENQQLFKDKMLLHITLMLLVLLGLIVVHSFITFIFSRSLWRQLDLFSRFFHKASTEAVSMEEYNFLYSEFSEISGMAGKMLEDRNRILQEISQSRDEWVNTFNAIGDCMMVLDANGHIRRANDAAIRIHALPVETMIDLDFNELCGHDNSVAATLADHQPHSVEIEHETLGRIFLTSAFPICSAEGKLHNIIHIAHDITEQKRLKEQLAQSQKMEAIGTLAGGIAHDFNNILGAILGYADLAERDCPPGSALKEYLSQIHRAGDRAKQLVRQILVFSRQAETKKVPLQPAPLIQETLRLLRASLPTTITIKQDIDETTGLILADPTHIHQILMNLGTNALHAMEETGGTLSVSLQQKSFSAQDAANYPNIQPGNFVWLTVRDDGIGITPEIRNKIFDPYYTTKKTGKGTGMGLAIVHSIVSSYGGIITLDSQPGKGTTFHLYFPLLEEDSLPEVEPIESITAGTERILFVDDEQMLVDMSGIMLKHLGYRVKLFSSSQEALTAFLEQPDAFDLVITDQTMPGLTGTQLAENILEIRPDQPIILCTGYSELVSEEKAKAIGIRRLVLKPINMHQLALLIRDVFNKKAASTRSEYH